ncbi:MAG: helix-turn-helix domain-containing protein [Gemmatimonadetes bacterium]|nr:helix-turn-helix domain-containing protein [Gemmatimonadota bacterium]
MGGIDIHPNRTSVFSPLAKAVLDSFNEGVVVFDHEGRLTYANSHGRAVLDNLVDAAADDAENLMPLLARLGGRIASLRVGSLTVGEAVFLPAAKNPRSLADRERQAIVDTLDKTSWRLAESARLLGISRTTLWRRLKAYGLDRDSRGRWDENT